MTQPSPTDQPPKQPQKCGHPIPWADEWWGIAACYRVADHRGLHGNDHASWTCEGMWCKHVVYV